MLSEISQRKKNAIYYHLYVKSKKVTHLKSKIVVIRGLEFVQ